MTCEIRGGWIAAWQGGRHCMLRNGVVVFKGNTIIHVGRSWDGRVDRVIDASGMFVSPGFISTHTHASSHVGDRLVLDDGRRDLLRTGFLNYAAPLQGRPGFSSVNNHEASIRFGLACMLKSGVTTAVQLDDGPLDAGKTFTRLAGESGMRVYYSPVFGGGRYSTDSAGNIECVIDEAGAMAGLDQAAAYIKQHDGDHDGRLRGILVLDELFNATPALLGATRKTADSLGVPITIHASEQLFEFHHILRSTGHTPVGWMSKEGFLGPDVILGHCIYVSGHSLSGYPFAGDLELLAQSGASVAHAPVALARRGITLESFQRYLDHGVRLSIGTDSYPLDILAEMRLAGLLGKVVEKNNEAARAADVFDAATTGGAQALGRSDLGRLAPGARADIVLIDFNDLSAGPVWDPIRTLLNVTSAAQVDTVIVDGNPVVEGRKLLMWNEAELLAAVRSGASKAWSAFADSHWTGEPAEQVFPHSLQEWSD